MHRSSWARLFSPLLLAVVIVTASAAQSSLEPRVVNIPAADGTVLKATYFAAAKPGPGVLLFHQCNQERRSWDALASSLAASGIHVLTVDYRGFGESGGTPVGKLPPAERQQIQTEKWPGDMDTAFDYLVSQPGVKRDVIGAGGASCGVNQSIQLARRHPEVKSLVLLSGNTDRSGREFVKNSPKLPIFGSAADDDAGAVELMEWVLSLSANPGTRFEHYKTGGHGTEMFAPHKELPDMIVEWFSTTLVKTPGKAPAAPSSARAPENAQILAMFDEPGGTAKVAEKLAEARKRDPKAVLFPEGVVNIMGYEHMQNGDTKGAIEILKLNVTAFPRSANTYDSLADAYLADGQRELAKQNAQKALELLASDTESPEDRKKLIRDSAEQKVKELGGGAQE
ncbi:MAG TPA: alpha/beta fold hydrolase [Terriglobales bacterium]|nr:alpha/beta fold hydrolase [Terriglobales bacterium]